MIKIINLILAMSFSKKVTSRTVIGSFTLITILVLDTFYCKSLKAQEYFCDDRVYIKEQESHINLTKKNKGKIYFEKALEAQANNQASLAIEKYTLAIKLNTELKNSYHNRGLLYQTLGQHKKALNDYNNAINLCPNFAIVYSSRGLLYQELGQYEQALSDYNKAIEIDPDSAIVYSNRGRFFFTLKKYDQALKDFDSAINLNPESADDYNIRGGIYHILKKYTFALSDYNKAIRLNPLYALAYNNRGVLYTKLKQYEKALESYNEALVINWQSDKIYFNRAENYYRMELYEKAIDNYKEAIKINPKHYYALGRMGWLSILQKEYSKSIYYSEKGIELSSTSQWIKVNLILALVLDEKYDKGLIVLRPLVKSFPDKKKDLIDSIDFLEEQGVYTKKFERLKKYLKSL